MVVASGGYKSGYNDPSNSKYWNDLNDSKTQQPITKTKLSSLKCSKHFT